MNAKKFLSSMALSVALMSPTFAAAPDDELSIMAAEQRREAPSDVDELDQSPPVEPPVRRENPQPIAEPPPVENTQPIANHPAVENTKPISNQPTVGLPNPMQSFGSFEEVVDELGYIPLYVPKGTGYNLNYMATIGGTVGELRYSRRWETEVNLVVRTYKRPKGEELRDISGIHGVKWRVDLSSGTPIYLARISENSNAAAWAIGQYTFAATADNLSFAAFRTLVFDELADLSSHYYVETD